MFNFAVTGPANWAITFAWIFKKLKHYGNLILTVSALLHVTIKYFLYKL